jgi:hypothetical protein
MGDILVNPPNSGGFTQALDIAFKSATILIAAFNAYFAVKFFWFKDKKDELEKERDRKIQLLKTLVLDHNLTHYHSIFDKLEGQLQELQSNGLTDPAKQNIDSKVGDLFIELRSKFYDALLAIDDKLYDNIKTKADFLQTHITNSIFDQGINLAHLPKYEELIKQKVISTKTEIIKVLFNYRG